MTIRKQSSVILPLAARVATPTAVDVVADSPGYSLIVAGSKVTGQILNFHLIIDVTAVTATPSVQLAIQALDPVSGKYYDLLTGVAAITGVGTTVFRVGKDIISAAALASEDFVPESLRFSFTHADADSITYSVGLNYELTQ